MATTDLVYYQNDRVLITRSELTLDGMKYRMALIRSVSIEARSFAEDPISAWARRVSAYAGLLLVIGWLLYQINNILFPAFQPIRRILEAVGWPLVMLVAGWWLVLELIELRRSRPVAEVPILRFRRYGWAGPDLWFASTDRAYLRSLVAVMREVLRNAGPLPVTIDAPSIEVTRQEVRSGDQVYPMAEVRTASYLGSKHQYVVWAAIATNLALLLWAAGRVLWDRPLGANLSDGSSAVIVSAILISAFARERRPPAYLLVLTGTFGTVYPFASTDSSRVSKLADTITKQLQANRATL